MPNSVHRCNFITIVSEKQDFFPYKTDETKGYNSRNIDAIVIKLVHDTFHNLSKINNLHKKDGLPKLIAYTCRIDKATGLIRNSINDSLLPTVYCLLPMVSINEEYRSIPKVYFNCLLPTAHCPLLTANCLLLIAYCQLLTSYCLMPTA